jgi:hypothetical protein
MKFDARRLVATSLVAIFAAFNLYTKLFYAYEPDQKNESYAIMLERLAELAEVPPNAVTMLDVPKNGTEALISLYTRGHSASEYSGQASAGLYIPFDDEMPPFLPHVWAAVKPLALDLVKSFRFLKFPLDHQSAGQRKLRRFILFDKRRHTFRRFVLLDKIPEVGDIMVTAAADESIINQSTDRPAVGRIYIQKLADTHNHLAQVESNLGHIAMPGRTKLVALWDREADFADPSRSIQATGRHILFEVVNPIPGSRMLLEWTRGPVGADDFALPPAEVIGDSRMGLGFVGRGAARMVSEPLVPRVIDGHFYVAVDMRADAQRFAGKGRGLAAIYKQRFGLDPRIITGFARNISLVTEEQFRAMKPPESVSHFPTDLLDGGLLFSGIYEDGWIAEVARIRLGSEKKVRSLRIDGHVPSLNQLNAGATLKVLVDGQQVAQRQLAPGDLELQAAIPEIEGPRWIELRVDRADRLSTEDQRVASIRLRSIELEGGLVSPPQAVKSFPADLRKPALSFTGIFDDGWMAEVARVRLGSEKGDGRIRVEGHVPGFNKLSAGATLEALVDGQQVARLQLASGDFEFQAPIPKREGPRWIELRVDRADRLSAEDQRVASIRLRSIELTGDSVTPPQAVKSFPADLRKPGLSFTGIFDDGWMAEVARVRLGSEKGVGEIRVEGYVPDFNRLRAGATFEIIVDGQKVGQRNLAPGDFELQASIPESEGPRWIELRADTSDRLSAADSRVASIRLKSIELLKSPNP